MNLLSLADSRRLPLPDGVVQCCVTSPPYFNLRDYQVPNQIGLEKTPEEYIGNLLGVFREVWRVLRDDGVLWVNIGDSYANDSKWGGSGSGPSTKNYTSGLGGCIGQKARRTTGYKPKELMLIPHRFAMAMQDDGWYLRSEVIWSKRSPMPESVRDRPTRAHEQFFLFSKQPRYFYDLYGVLEKAKYGSSGRADVKKGGFNSKYANDAARKGDESFRAISEKRNIRSVWSLSNESFKGAHYAVMPSKLVIPCIKAGSSEKGCCPECRSPWKRIVEKLRAPTRPGRDTKVTTNNPLAVGNRDPERHVTSYKSVGWEPTCDCGIDETMPCLVIDPFSGAGTVPMVADNLGHHGIGFDAGMQYCRMACERINNPHLEVAKSARVDKPMPLFDVMSGRN